MPYDVERMTVLKRYLCTLLTLVFLFSVLPSSARAEFDPNGITTEHVVLMEASTGTVLFEKNGNEKAFPASTTKILTCIIALENGNLDDAVTIGSEVESKGSLMGIVRREEMTLRDLVYGMMLVSGNDAARAIAEHISGSEQEFANLMNEKAASIGMTGSHFVKPNGLHNDDHYTTAVDMALLTRYAMKNPDFREIVSRKIYEVPPTNKDSDGYLLENTNKLIYKKADDTESYLYAYATGVKTGDTDQAGRCLVAAAEKDGVELIAVLLGDKEFAYRFETAASLFDWGFNNCMSVNASELGLPASVETDVSNASFEDPNNGKLELTADFTDKKITGLRTDIESLVGNVSAVTMTPAVGRLAAPVKKGDRVGTVSYQYNGRTLFETDLIASRDVAEIAANTVSPSASPLITEGSEENGSKASPLLFWILASVVLVAIAVVALKLILNGNRRKRRRRLHSYYVYKKK
jgi:D-alanyl-D-alanine carboxypeptidase